MVEIAADDKIFFLHIPKTAGTSLRTLLEQHFNAKEIYHLYLPADLETLTAQPEVAAQTRFICGHRSYSAVNAALGYTPITLTMLREPIDRLVSLWSFFQTFTPNPKISRQRRESIARIKELSLEQFIEEMATGTAFDISNLQTHLIGSSHGDRNETQVQVGVAKLPTEDTLQTAMQRLPTFAWVGTTERYQESLALLAYTFGWLPTRMNKRLNVTPKRPRLEQLVPHLRDQIAAVCQLDQRLYRYTTELFEQRFMAMCLDLLERYGDREHAHLKLPLAHDVLLELLDRHFIHCATTSASPARGTTGRIDQPFEGDGWHHLEYTPTSEAYRWSGPTNESELVLLLTPGHAYHLSVRIIHALSLDTLHSLRISANQAELASTLQNEPDGAHRITAIIPATSEPMVRIRFQVDQAIKPSVGDDRTLGLAFGVLSVEPIGEAYATTG